MKDKILKIVETKGPLLPALISKQFNIDSLMAAAYLSELVSNKKIMLSHLKVGGSPIYYTENQKARLQDYKNNLSEKDQQAYDLLKKEKILRDSELSPLMRLAMRTIKDFAVPLKVNKKEIFWKWYLLSNEEALKFIKQKLTKKPEKPIEKIPKKKGAKTEIKLKDIEKKQEAEQRSETLKRQKEEIEKIEKQKSEEIKKREKELEKKEIELLEKLKEEKEKLDSFKKKEKALEEKEKKLIEKLKKEKEKLEQELKQKEEEFRKRLLEEQQKGEEEQQEEEKDDFLEKIKMFCESKNIMVEEAEIIRKNKEVEMIVSIPTPVGHIQYFCRAKDKKRCNDADLSSAYLKGQSKVLPTLFLTTGDLTKKAEEMLGNEFKQMVVKKIENGSTDN